MNEIYNQLLTYLLGVWRRRWWGIMIAWLVCVGGWVFVATLPDQYRSSARVYVDAQSLLGPLMRGLAVQGNIYGQIDFMQRTLLSRPNLEKVARMTDLDLTVNDTADMNGLIEQLKGGVRISSQGRNLFNISFEHTDPDVSKRVVQALLTIFVESNLGASRKDLSEARRFIGDQIKNYERQLEEAENRLAEYKRQNLGFLSGQGGYYKRLQQVRGELANEKAVLAESVSRRDELTVQLKKVPQFIEVEAESSEEGAGPGPDSGLQVKILDLEYRIEQMLQNFTPKHPDVISTQRLLESLRAKWQAEQDAAAEALAKAEEDGTSEKATPRATKKVPNPLYDQIKLQLVNAEAQIAILKQRVGVAESKVSGLQRLADTVPLKEAELKRLNRDYGIIKKNYEQLLSRRESAKLAQDLETNADQVQFRVVDPPQVPLKPSGPNRLLFLSAVLAAGLGAGLAFAFALSQIDDSIPNVLRLRESFALPVLGGVSAIMSSGQKRRRILELSSFAMISVGLVTAYGGLVAVEVLNFLRVS